ncbi:CYTH domain-containing protein [Polaribacter sp. WD7]|uniref:CYTH domain-containing protein n=1 Tax=Polaribacter sp. WD7 TaxID=2269061 RepID=UPI000DF2E95A|nr:CYTH domain-containing protein [Polaribacter sp. WD7]RCS26213.1 CYTH domain-containing protein [Polaribacter sp. WD7]
MGIEIERKFLVKSDVFKKQNYQKNYIKQGYLNSDKNRTVRIRILDDRAFLTIKGKSNVSGTSRFEWEKEIMLDDAKSLFLLCEDGSIEKTRYLIKQGQHIFEVDDFHGDNDGLMIAEIELFSENELFEKPDWLGKEVTGELKYYNSSISKNPFKNWK